MTCVMISLLWIICFKNCISVYELCCKSTNGICGDGHRDNLKHSAEHDIVSSFTPGVEPEAFLVKNEFGVDD
jgi:hypothetical protein